MGFKDFFMEKIEEEKPANINKNALVLEIPGSWSNKEITFKKTFLEYENKKIFYKDIVGVSYLAIKKSLNYFIPLGTEYKFELDSEKDEISISFSGDEKLWVTFINLSKGLIEPLIIERIVKSIFEKKETISIGGIDFDNKGYHRTTFFGKIDSVLWEDRIYLPQFREGCVYLFKEKKGVGRGFASTSMGTLNAVILPELVQACVSFFHTKK